MWLTVHKVDKLAKWIVRILLDILKCRLLKFNNHFAGEIHISKFSASLIIPYHTPGLFVSPSSKFLNYIILLCKSVPGTFPSSLNKRFMFLYFHTKTQVQAVQFLKSSLNLAPSIPCSSHGRPQTVSFWKLQQTALSVIPTPKWNTKF